jgi:hypothetical protein
MHAPRIPRLALLTVLGAVLAAASNAPVASAATPRYASPTGSGTACSSASPCSIRQAVEGAAPGDEVIVNPGDYPLTATLEKLGQITIHGVAGKPRPRLLFSGAGQNGLKLYFDSLLRYVEIDQADANGTALGVFGAKVDQVIAKAPGLAVNSRETSTIRNSIAVASGTNARALLTSADGGGDTNTVTLRNVTAIATGSGGVPIEATASTTGTATIHLVNVIAYAGPGAISLTARTDDSGAQATITATHTNYQSVDTVGSNAAAIDGGGNRAEEPAFANAAAGDYHQAAGAYTIDAGLDEPINGAFDLDGDPRTIGTTDIGADEFVPAPTPTPPPPPPAPTSPAQTPTTQPPAATPAFAGVKLVSRRLSFRRRFITLKLSCPVATVGRCSGRTKLTARPRASSHRVTLGRARFSIAADKRGRVRVRVSRAGRRLLRSMPRRGRAVNAARDGAGQSKTTVARVTIRRRHR